MDFIPFNDAMSNRNKTSSPNSFKNISQKKSPGVNMPKSLSFGSPAPAFGSPAVNFGAPAFQNTGFKRQNSTPSPRHYSPRHSPGANAHMNPFFQQSPRGHSPRQYSPYHAYGNNNQSNNSFNLSREGSGFKTPHYFSPNRGRGNGRKSFSNQFGQTPRFDCNAGGSLNIEDYYHPNMIEDPWRYSKPVFIKT